MCEEVVVAEALQNLLHLGLVFGKRALGEDHDVVNVNDYDVVHVRKDFVHHSLERGGGVAESEEHDSGFVGSSMTDECCFPFITFLDLHIVVPPPKVYLREVLRSLELVDELQNERERVIVSYSVLIEVPVVLDHLLSSVFLWHKEYRRCLFRLGRMNIPLGELFINKL